MSRSKKIREYFERSREKHKLTFIDDSNYKEKWSFRVSSLNLISLLGLYTILILVATFTLIKVTPLKSLFSANNSYENELLIEENEKLIDSLYASYRANQIYLEDLNRIVNNHNFEDSLSNNTGDSLENYEPNFTKSESDSLLRLKVEEDIATQRSSGQSGDSYDFFFAPVNGLVSRSFDKVAGHYGVDIVTLEDEPIKACLEGRVVLTGWIQSEGKIVVMQHRGDLISIYKHCSSILKVQGEYVQTGDPIAIVGNSGENTSGPHLHFELWKKEQVMDPEEFISFE